tara:strand:+ start:580 stop:1782 length:1203 start_codon:yes stop_codon:yes gene_type:complete
MKRLNFWLAVKMLSSRKEIVLISWTGFISIIGVSLGLLAILISISVLNGFEKSIRNKIINFETDIRLANNKNLKKDKILEEKLNNFNEIESFSFFIDKKAIAMSNEQRSLYKIKAIEIDKFQSVYNFLDLNISNQKLNDGFILGSGVAKRLGVVKGDDIRLMNPFDNQIYFNLPKMISGEVVEIFETRILDFDQTYIFTSFSNGQKLFSKNNLFDGIDIRLKNNKDKKQIKNTINKILDEKFEIQFWEDIHKTLFQAMKMEKLVSILVLSLVVIVACFNITSTLTMQTVEKIREVGILKTIGFSNDSIRNIFFFQGILIGGIGILIGAFLGFLIIFTQNRYEIIKLPKSVYFIDSLPMYISNFDYFFISSITMLIVIISIYFPIRQLRKINPSNAIQHQK